MVNDPGTPFKVAGTGTNGTVVIRLAGGLGNQIFSMRPRLGWPCGRTGR